MLSQRLKRAGFAAAFAAATFGFASSAHAAVLNFTASSDTFPAKQEFLVNVRIDSEGEGINGAQAVLKFDNTVLEAIKADRSPSIFNFWLAEPTIDNAAGQIRFIAGATTGYEGKSLEVLRLTLKSKGPGSATLSFNDAAVTAADGSGTNVLTRVNNLALTFTSQTGLAEVPKPKQIVREPAPATGLPAKPEIQVPLYPNQKGWSGVSDKFFVKWMLPADVTGVAATVNSIPNFTPSANEGLFEEKAFSSLEDGTYFAHVRFKNAIGWGPAAHYRIGIDTAPPAAFTASLSGGSPTDNPAPTLEFAANDALSGIDHYDIKLDDLEAVSLAAGPYVAPLLTPGKHVFAVMATDAAGNIAKNVVAFEILSIEVPDITNVSRDAYVGEGGVSVAGTVKPEYAVRVQLKGESGEMISFVQASPDGYGNWQAVFDRPLKPGTYFIEASSLDGRGAVSAPARSEAIRVRERPLLVLAGVELSPTAAVVFLLFLIAVGVAAGVLAYRTMTSNIRRRSAMAQRDALALSKAIYDSVDKMIKLVAAKGAPDVDLREQIKVLAGKVKSNAERAQKFLVEAIGEIKK